MIFYHKRPDYRMGDEIFNIALLKYFKINYGYNFFYQDVNFYLSAIDFFPDDLVVFSSENFYEYPIFYAGDLWFWNQMLREKKCYATSKIQYDPKKADIDLVFLPLISPAYNFPRGMKTEMIVKFINLISNHFPNSKIIIDENKKAKHFDHPNTVYSSNIHDTLNYVKRSKIYIGGDTGISHFAGSINHPNMILFYPDESLLENFLGEIRRKEIFDIFGDKEIFNYSFSSLPCCDPSNFQTLQLVANEISCRQLMEAIEKIKTA